MLETLTGNSDVRHADGASDSILQRRLENMQLTALHDPNHSTEIDADDLIIQEIEDLLRPQDKSKLGSLRAGKKSRLANIILNAQAIARKGGRFKTLAASALGITGFIKGLRGESGGSFSPEELLALARLDQLSPAQQSRITQELIRTGHLKNITEIAHKEGHKHETGHRVVDLAAKGTLSTVIAREGAEAAPKINAGRAADEAARYENFRGEMAKPGLNPALAAALEKAGLAALVTHAAPTSPAIAAAATAAVGVSAASATVSIGADGKPVSASAAQSATATTIEVAKGGASAAITSSAAATVTASAAGIGSSAASISGPSTSSSTLGAIRNDAATTSPASKPIDNTMNDRLAAANRQAAEQANAQNNRPQQPVQAQPTQPQPTQPTTPPVQTQPAPQPQPPTNPGSGTPATPPVATNPTTPVADATKPATPVTGSETASTGTGTKPTGTPGDTALGSTLADAGSPRKPPGTNAGLGSNPEGKKCYKSDFPENSLTASISAVNLEICGRSAEVREI